LVRDFAPLLLPQAQTSQSGKPPPPEIRTMRERHPRTALGWNDRYFYLVTVDGRQPRRSVGMTLEELARYLVSLGCREAMNLDGGGSTMMWVGDGVVNSPSDGEERAVANALILLRKAPAH
jgi:exopolysaccharide biosynthesis protein